MKKKKYKKPRVLIKDRRLLDVIMVSSIGEDNLLDWEMLGGVDDDFI